jgi:hypothetical protein
MSLKPSIWALLPRKMFPRVTNGLGRWLDKPKASRMWQTDRVPRIYSFLVLRW